MKSIFDIPVIDDLLLESIINKSEFYEFSNTLKELNAITNSEFYLEKVQDVTPDLRKVGNNIFKNTFKTTKDILNIYGNVTDSNADLMKASWVVAMRSINLITKVTSFIINKITYIPNFIIKTSDRIVNIPGEIKAKMKGNITLHITASDIEIIYNKLLMNRIREYITLASELSKGEFWSTFTRKRSNNNDEKGNILFGTNDMKLCRKMDEIYKHFKNTEFSPTIINLKDENLSKIYLDGSKSIKFTDNYGRYHECSYYEALNIASKDLNSLKNELKNVHLAIGDKLRTTEANQSYNRLDNNDKKRLNTTLLQITKVVTIIGNFIKYIIDDLNSIIKIINKYMPSNK